MMLARIFGASEPGDLLSDNGHDRLTLAGAVSTFHGPGMPYAQNPVTGSKEYLPFQRADALPSECPTPADLIVETDRRESLLRDVQGLFAHVELQIAELESCGIHTARSEPCAVESHLDMLPGKTELRVPFFIRRPRDPTVLLRCDSLLPL